MRDQGLVTRPEKDTALIRSEHLLTVLHLSYFFVLKVKGARLRILENNIKGVQKKNT